MTTIKWSLPFQTMDYLLSITEYLVDSPLVKLITGIEDSEGRIKQCNITIENNDNMEETIFYLGATIGSHAAHYATEKFEAVQREVIVQKLEQELEEVTLIPEIFQEEIIQTEDEFFKEDEFETLIVTQEHYKESPQIIMLRLILENFKKA